MSTAGPAGTGLLPPGVNAPVDDQDDEPLGDTGMPPVEDSQPPVPPASVDIDGVPPVPGDDDDDDDQQGRQTDDGEEIDPEEFREELLGEMQRRFDKAISKLTRKIEGIGTPPPPTGGGGNEDDDDDGAPPPPRRQSGSGHVDRTTIRVLARDRVSDMMEKDGGDERRAVKGVLDQVLPAIDWSQVDDQEEFVDELVTRLSGTAKTLVKVGSDRKVAQLRSAGLIPEAPRQPGGGAGQTATSTATQMQQGAAKARARFPGGKRRYSG